ncbi:MAG: hypothetical protein AUJ72_01675 [Candidatus Omnitrophica bacterium CG1_02_46_14]|nr:MAG: hypothetical protein AUJ72_01675 [Candidatus Omnitrophica bacterium CG1_02_46_14]
MPKRIMIVDDDREYTRLFHQMLDHLGHDIVEVTNGAEVYRRLMTESFDLVLLDYKMRDVRGDLVCEIIRSEDRLKNIPLIMVTGHRELDKDFFKTIGASDVLYKPLERAQLVDTVEKYLS